MSVRIGMVGAGYIAGRHVGSLIALDGVDVVGIADPRTGRAQELAARAGATPYRDWQGLLDAEDLDALYVCVPPAAHGGVEEAAIERRMPFFVEKPLAVDLATAERLADLIDARGLVTSVGYHWRYLDTLQHARELLGQRPPRLLLGAWLDKAPGVDWWARQAQSGGQTVEQVTHLFDVARLLAGEVESGHALGSRSADGPGDILDVATAVLRFRDGAVGSFSSSCLLPRGLRIGVEVVAPGLGLWLTERDLRISDGDGERTMAAAVDPIAAEDRAFVDAVRGEPEGIRAPYREALATHRLATAVAAAADGGGAVELPGASAA